MFSIGPEVLGSQTEILAWGVSWTTWTYSIFFRKWINQILNSHFGCYIQYAYSVAVSYSESYPAILLKLRQEINSIHAHEERQYNLPKSPNWETDSPKSETAGKLSPQSLQTPERFQQVWITQRNMNKFRKYFITMLGHWSVAQMDFNQFDEKTGGQNEKSRWTVPFKSRNGLGIPTLGWNPPWALL